MSSRRDSLSPSDLRTGSGSFLVQPFTTDHKLLLDAVHKAIPRFPPQEREYLTDFDTLRQVAVSLSQLPGRKNALWFSGGSTEFLCLMLSRSRMLPGAISTMSSIRNASLSTRSSARALVDTTAQMVVAKQHLVMSDVGQATVQPSQQQSVWKKSQIIFLSRIAAFYTPTYSPDDLRLDNQWHKVRRGGRRSPLSTQLPKRILRRRLALARRIHRSNRERVSSGMERSSRSANCATALSSFRRSVAPTSDSCDCHFRQRFRLVAVASGQERDQFPS